MSSCAAHILCFNESEILPYTLRAFGTFCEQIIVHDAFSTDGSRDIARHFGAEVVDWHCIGVNDMIAKKTKEDAVMNCRLDWCAVVDSDEILYFPEGSFHTLAAYDAAGVAIVKTKGYEMFSDTFPTTDQQIYDEVKMGAPDFKWYSKPILCAPKRIKSLTFGAGCHQAWAFLADGRTRWDDIQTPNDPPTLLLHCHHLGGLDRTTRRYAGQQSRHSKTNIEKRFGNFDKPNRHAQDKRAAILALIQRVIP